MEGGYPLEYFVESVDDRLLCKLCNRVLRRAKTTPCGQFYCKACVERWATSNDVCPRRCCELASQNTTLLAWAGHVDTIVSGLKTHCQNASSGCSVQVPLREKTTHELCCPCNDRTSDGLEEEAERHTANGRRANSFTQLDSRLDDFEDEKESLGFFKRATKIVLSFRSAKSGRKKQSSHAKGAKSSKEQKKVAVSMPTQRTYRMKRNKPKEPLGLVLLSGDKTSDGRHKSYYVKKVNRDTLGWRAGIQAGDRIIKVDNYDLSSLTPQDSVARIKEKSVVTITILRETGAKKLSSLEHNSHIYDEIYTDHSQPQNQHALSQPTPRTHAPLPGLLPPTLSQYDENHPPTPPPLDFGKFSPSIPHNKPRLTPTATSPSNEDHQRPRHRDRAVCLSPGAKVPQRSPPSCVLGERTSKDSGLSSGSSDSNPAQKLGNNNVARQLPPTPLTAEDLDRDVDARQSYRSEREMVKRFIKNKRRNGPAIYHELESYGQHSTPRNNHIVGEHELEEIHLQKNGTSQLGITLGYDATGANGGCLYVCEIVSGGLAAADGRLRTGDIIHKVNGFKVFDPEEAILLFLEQDQDITLSVARKIKVPTKLRPQPEPDLDYLESTLLREGLSIRKVDSCGSLDTHSYHHYATLEPPPGLDSLPTLQPPSETGSGTAGPAVILRERTHDFKMIAMSYDSVNDPPSTPQQALGEDDLYRSRRSSTPGHLATPLGHGRQTMGSSPNLLRTTSGADRPPPPSLSHHHTVSGSHLPTAVAGGAPLGPINIRLRVVPHDNRSSSTSPDGKHCRPIGGVIHHHRKFSTPNTPESPASSLTAPHDHEPMIMAPPSPTKTPPSFRNAAGNEIHRLPNRFENVTFLDPSSAGIAQGRRESLV